MSLTYTPSQRVGPFVLGLGATLAGHVLTVAAMVVVGRILVGGKDLEAGGRFGVAVVMMITFGVAQALLLAATVPVGTLSLQRRPMLGAGLLAGWLIGFLTLVVLAVLFFYNAGNVEVAPSANLLP